MRLRTLCWAWVVWVCLSGVAHAQQNVVSNQVALFPAHYADAKGEPPVAPFMEDINSGLKRIWTGTALVGQELEDAMGAAWVSPVNTDAQKRVQEEAARAEEIFLVEDSAKAIAPLERLLKDADALLAHTSADKNTSKMLFMAHLRLWQSLKAEGKADGAKLSALMENAAARFPAARPTSNEIDPEVVDAFEKGRSKNDTALNIILQDIPAGAGQSCSISINGFVEGDGRQANVAVRSGRTYYVVGSCGDLTLTPRRVTVNKPMELRLSMLLARAMERTSAGPTLRLIDGEKSVANIVSVGVAMGRALGSGEVWMVGVGENEALGRFLQFDRIDTQEATRLCSIRLKITERLDRAGIDQALRAVRSNKPTPEDEVDVYIALNDNVYRDRDEYLEVVATDGSRIFTWTVGSIAAASLTAGIAFEFLGQTAQQDLDDCIAAPECRGTPQTERLRNDLDDTLITRDTLYIVGGVLAVGAVVLYFVESPSQDEYLSGNPDERADRWGMAPWMTPTGGGMGVFGQF